MKTKPKSHRLVLERTVAALAVLSLGLSSCAPGPSDQGSSTEPHVVQQALVTAPAPVTATLTAARDTSIRLTAPNVNSGRETALDINRTLVAFDQAALQAALGPQDYLVSARLELTLTNNSLRRLAPAKAVTAHRLTKAWTETGATWLCAVDANPSNRKADCSGATAWWMGPLPPNPFVAQPSDATTISPKQTGVIGFDVTADVRNFVGGQQPNHGWMLRSGWLGEFAEFASREGGSPPRLVLTVQRCSASLCDDGNACTIDSCDAVAACVHSTAADGASCSDGNACTEVDRCVAGSCQAGPVDVCAPPPIVINEVESNGGVPGDWVELYNAGSSAVDLSNWVFKDSDDTHSFTLPAGTSIAPGSYVVLDEAAFGFGLGAGDSTRLFDSGTRLIDTYSWATHASTSYGRCPDGSGGFATTTVVSKGAVNDCSPPTGTGGAGGGTGGTGTGGAGGSGTGGAGGAGGAPIIVINEVESNQGVPGDWIELFNPGGSAIDVSGWVLKDNDDTHASTVPANTSIAPGGYLVVEETTLGFGLGAADSARLFDGTRLVDTYTWATHATTSYGRCPNGSGAFTTTTAVSKGTANDCSPPTGTGGAGGGTGGAGGAGGAPVIVINEVESNLGVPGDWIELFNPGGSAIDVSGWVLKDNDDTHASTVPANTSIAPGGYLVVEETALGFGLGAADSARLFDGTRLVDTYTWATHATTSYGRCPNGSGAFTTTGVATKGAANDCSPPTGTGGTGGTGTGGAGGTGGITFAPWPGDSTVDPVDTAGAFGSNLSGLTYQAAAGAAPAVLWAVQNSPSKLFRMQWNGTAWVNATSDDWGNGKTLVYPAGTGGPDTEGVTRAEEDSTALYVAAERDNTNNGVSRLSVLRYDSSVAGPTLIATHEWNLTADLPVVGPNLGLEAITWVPDSYLVANGFHDEFRAQAYDPAAYPGHGGGLFFVGIEASGTIYVYALDHEGGGFQRVATFSSGQPGVMGIEFDRDVGRLWTYCDNTCGNRATLFSIDSTAGASQGRFVLRGGFSAAPPLLPDTNNEGLAIAPESECVAGRKHIYWSDDGATGGHSIRRGTIPCGPLP